MIETFKQLFFGMFWFTADCVMLFVWISVISAIISGIRKND